MRTHLFFRRKAASQYLKDAWGLNCAHGTLAKLAVIGGGPIFRRMGRVPLYSMDDLDNWVEFKLSPPLRSTSDAAHAKSERGEHAQQAGHDGAIKVAAEDREQPGARRRGERVS